MFDDRLNAVLTSIKTTCMQGMLHEHAELTGFSGKKVIGALQRIAREVVDENTVYVEVGVFQGLSLLSVGKSLRAGHAIGIDNFAYFDKDGKNYDIVKQRQQKLGLNNVQVINQDFEKALQGLDSVLAGRKVSLFFLDGPHDYRSQLMGLLLIKPLLAEGAVIVVDDSNYRHVRQANRDFLIANPEFKLIFETYTVGHPATLKGDDRKEVEDGWWNGLNVFFHDATDQIRKVSYPPVFEDKTLFENEHIVHGFKYPAEIPRFLDLILSIESKRPIRSIHHLIKLFFRKRNKKFDGTSSLRNTFSENLSSEHFTV
jgi:predicted O-methyltransferase YrrM